MLFREPTLWQRYCNWFVAGISDFVAQALLISGLLLNRARRRRAELRLIQSRSQLRGILDTAIKGVTTVNERGLIESPNPAAEGIVDCRVAE